MAPSAVKPTTGNHFEATYEAPFGGINNSSDSIDIAPNEFADLTNITVQANRLVTASMDNFRANSDDITTLFPTTPVGDEYIIMIFHCNGFMCCVDQYINTYIYGTKGANFGFIQDQPGFGPASTSYATINVIGSITLIGVPAVQTGTPTVYLYQPSITIQIATTFAVGLYVGEISGYAIQVNTNQPSDNPGINNNRFNWSSPFQYSTWDPSVSRNAGFDVISDSPEQLTAFSGHGSVGYIYRPNGLTQVSLTGVAIQPFDLVPVSQGQSGIGCRYGLTLAQYSGIDFFVAESGVYTWSSDFTNVGKKAWAGIFNTIINSLVYGFQELLFDDNNYYAYAGNSGYYRQFVPDFCGIIGNNNTSSLDPTPFYNLVIPTYFERTILTPAPVTFTDTKITTWIYDINTKSWYKTQIPSAFDYLTEHYPLGGGDSYGIVTVTVRTAYFNQNIAQYDTVNNAWQPLSFDYSNEAITVFIFNYTKRSTGNTGYTFSVPFFNNTSGVVSQTETATNPPAQINCNITCRTEQLKLGRYVTIVRVVIRAAGTGTIVPAITGLQSPNENSTDAPVVLTTLFNPIIINSPIPATYYSSGIYTGEDPQLQLNSIAFDGFISKIMMVGTYADGDID